VIIGLASGYMTPPGVFLLTISKFGLISNYYSGSAGFAGNLSDLGNNALG
jgi:hypothetical protein